MTDMLVKLYTLPPLETVIQQQKDRGISLRRAIAPEKHHILNWVRLNFSEFWVSECDVAINSKPVSCWIAMFENRLIGFGCYDTTCKGFFGPTGVSEDARGRGTGTALLLSCLYDMRSQGYGYAIIGHVGPTTFYERVVGAIIIQDSTPGVYAGLLRDTPHA